MDRLIAVWGSVNSGKTTFAAKLACGLYDHFKGAKRVAAVFADNGTPVLPYLLPNYRRDDLRSIGYALSRPAIAKEDILKCFVTVENRQNFGILGYTDGENRYSYPEISAESAGQLLEVLSFIVDYIVVDCRSGPEDPFTEAALSKAGTVFRLCAPDLKSVSWMSSVESQLANDPFLGSGHVKILNVNRDDLYYPVEETAYALGGADYIIRYSGHVARQWLDGKLLSRKGDRYYDDSLAAILREKVLAEA